MNTLDPLLLLKLSIQSALLGEVTDGLIAVTCGLEERHVKRVTGKVKCWHDLSGTSRLRKKSEIL